MPKPKSIISKTLKADPILIEKPKPEPQDAARGNPFRRDRANTAGSSAKPKIDINSFTAFILTGEMPSTPAEEDQYLPPKSNRPGKRVTFDTGPPQIAEAAGRSLEELMRQRQSMPQLVPSNRVISSQHPQGNYNVGNVFNTTGPISGDQPQLQPLTSQDTGIDPVDDADIETDTFKNVNIDSVLYHGVSNLPPPIPKHRAGSIFTLSYDSPSPSPPITGFNQYTQVPSSGPPVNNTASVPSRAPPLPPKVRVSDASNGSFTNNERPSMSSTTLSPLPVHTTGPTLPALVPTPTGPTLPALVPTPTGPVLGKQNAFAPLNPPQNLHSPVNGSSGFSIPHDIAHSPVPFGLSPQATGSSNPPPPPPPPALRSNSMAYGQTLGQPTFSHQGGSNSPSPSLAAFESIFHAPSSQPQSQHLSISGPAPNLPQHSFDQRHQSTGSSSFMPHSQETHMFPPPPSQTSSSSSIQNIPPPPPRRSVSGGPSLSIPSTATGNQPLGMNGMRRTSGPGGPTMTNGMLAPPPPPPSRRRLLSASAGSPNTFNGQFHSSSATNLPTSMGEPVGLQSQFTGHQILYTTPTASNSVPNLLTNGMQNLGLNR